MSEKPGSSESASVRRCDVTASLTTGAYSQQTPAVPEVETNYLAVQYIGDIYPVAYSDGWSVFADWHV